MIHRGERWILCGPGEALVADLRCLEYLHGGCEGQRVVLFRLVPPWGRWELEPVVVVVHHCGLSLWGGWDLAPSAQINLCLGIGMGSGQPLNQRQAPEGEPEVESFELQIQCPW